MKKLLDVTVLCIACCVLWSVWSAGCVNPSPSPTMRIERQNMRRITPNQFEQRHVPESVIRLPPVRTTV